jgi:hypothetical protein
MQKLTEKNIKNTSPKIIILTPMIKRALSLGAKITSSIEKGSSRACESMPSYGFISLYVNADKAKVPHIHIVEPEDITWALMVVGEIERTEKFAEYKEKIEDKRVIVSNILDNTIAKIIKPCDSSRYFPKGRKRMQAKIYKRLGRWYNCPGLLISLTFDPGKITRYEAWKKVGKLRREFMDRVNRWRKRHGMKKAKFLSVIEVQPGTGYPHVHLVFPYLKSLAPIGWMTEQWGQAENSVDYKVRDSMSPVSYVCKYISKLEGWSDWALSYIWENKTRLYSMSRDYMLPDYSDKRVPEWQFEKCLTKEKIIAMYRNKYLYMYRYLDVDEDIYKELMQNAQN